MATIVAATKVSGAEAVATQHEREAARSRTRQTHSAIIKRKKGGSLGLDIQENANGRASIESIVAGSCASTAEGIKLGDVILAVNGKDVTDVKSIISELRWSGTEVKLGLGRVAPVAPEPVDAEDAAKLQDDKPCARSPAFSKWFIRLFISFMIFQAAAVLSGHTAMGPFLAANVLEQVLQLSLFLEALLVVEVTSHRAIVQQVVLGTFLVTFGGLAVAGGSIADASTLDVSICWAISLVLSLGLLEAIDVPWSKLGTFLRLLLVIAAAYCAFTLDGFDTSRPPMPPTGRRHRSSSR